MDTNIEKKKLRRSCVSNYDGCFGTGFAGEDVIWTVDPYNQEIHGDETKMWLCHNCIEISCMEI